MIGKKTQSARAAPDTRPVWRLPAIQALLIQLFAFVSILAVTQLTGVGMPTAWLGLSQGILAAIISAWCGLASWWLLIQLVFPDAAIAMQSLALPPMGYFFAFTFFLCLFWTTFSTQVPFFPSGRVTWRQVENLLPRDDSVRFVDIGSGLGGLVMHLAECRPDGIFIGVEIAPLPWFISQMRVWLRRSRGHFIRGDYMELDFASFDVVFAYLSPAAMQILWNKAQTEMRPGTLLLSYEFPIIGVDADITTTPDTRGAVIYGWRM